MITFSLPKIDATATYAYRDSGGSWSSESSMVYGFAEPNRSFASPVCDEFRLTISYSEITTFDRFFISTLNINSGLSFSLDVGFSNYSFSQDTESSPRNKQNQIYRIPAPLPASDSVTITITGIGQKSLSFGQLVMAKTSFTPTLNIAKESNITQTKIYTEQRTRLGFVQRIDNSARRYELSFFKLSQSELDQLEKLIDVQSNNGFLLFELDNTSDRLDNAFLSYTSIIETEPTYVGFHSANIKVMEAYGRG